MTNEDYQTSVNDQLLGSFYELCYRAHTGTSFSPEKRAVMYIKEFSQILEEDLKLLGDNHGNYQAKFINYFRDWMNSKSRCISSMIAGPSNFPVRKANKANNAEHKKYTDFMKWRTNYFNAVKRVPTKSPEEDLEIAERKLEQQLNLQIRLKEINKLIRRLKSDSARDIIAHLNKSDYEFTPSELQHIRENYKGGFSVPSYTLTNLNARIKSTKEKIQIMLNRIEIKKTWEDILFDGGYVTIEDDRLKIFHDEKPDNNIILELKKNGFRWSPNWGCWCRKHTQNALYTMRKLSFMKGKR